MSLQVKEQYQVGIYLRLSREDISLWHGRAERHRCESDSIVSQRELCLSFVQRHGDMEVRDIYTDDGYSGTNFDRPEFQRMMGDIRAGRIDCVVVKDLSRFGRDYIEAGRLIQRTFPAFDVRFIAVTDRFDSLTADYNECSLVLPVKNFVNDAYCKDISDKVKSHQRIKRENGEFIGAFAVYGYRKDPLNRNHLVPDEYAAVVVRNIFDWRGEGMSATAIAAKLNALGILSPLEHKRALGEHYATSFATGIQAKWSAAAVRRILTNPVYVGTLEQGKTEKINIKVNRYREKPKEEWARVEQAHEPVISREEFDSVQRLMETESRAEKGGDRAHMFSGLLFCGDCGAPMVRRRICHKGEEKICFICSTKNKGRGCTRHSISERELREAVLGELAVQAASGAHRDGPPKRDKETGHREIMQIEQEIERLKGQQEQYLSLREGVYADWKKGILTREDYCRFQEFYLKKSEETGKAIDGQQRLIEGFLKCSGERGGRDGKETQCPAELNRGILIDYVRRIRVYEDKVIRVEMNREG